MKILLSLLSISFMLPTLSVADPGKNSWNLMPRWYRVIEGSAEEKENQFLTSPVKQARIVPWEEIKQGKQAMKMADAYSELRTVRFSPVSDERSTALSNMHSSQVDDPEWMWELAKLITNQSLSNHNRSVIIFILGDRQSHDPGVHTMIAQALDNPDLRSAATYALERIQYSFSKYQDFSDYVSAQLVKTMFVESGVQDQAARTLHRTGRNNYELLEYTFFCDSNASCNRTPSTLSHTKEEFKKIDPVVEHKKFMEGKTHYSDTNQRRISDYFGSDH